MELFKRNAASTFLKLESVDAEKTLCLPDSLTEETVLLLHRVLTARTQEELEDIPLDVFMELYFLLDKKEVVDLFLKKIFSPEKTINSILRNFILVQEENGSYERRDKKMIEEILSKSRIGALGSIFFDVDVKIHEYGKPSRTVSKTLTFGDYVKWLNQTLKKKEAVSYYPVGPIPKGYVDCCIGNDGSFYAAICVPGGKKQVIHVGNPMYCAFPALVFLLHVNQKGTLSKAKCFALKEDSVKENTTLWQYPYGHVSSDGKICMGSVPRNNLHGLISAEKVIEDFFLGEDMGHYYQKNYTYLNVPIGELFTIMEKADTFPVQYLTGGKKTFHEEWKKFIK